MKYLHDVWLQKVKESPGKIAVEDKTGSYTYADLEGRVDQWVNAIAQNKIIPGGNILLIADASFEAVSLLVACSKSQLVFTVLSPETPVERIHTIMDDLAPELVIRELQKNEDHPPVVGNFKLPFQSVFSISQYTVASRAHWTNINTTTPAYIVFTSGSTGKPKGIVMSHGSCASFWDGLIDHARLDVTARYASLSPLQFDFSLLDIGLCLGSGVTIIFPNRANLKKPRLMVTELIQKQITHFSGVPTLWKMFLLVARNELKGLTTLKSISFAGEHFPKENMCEIANILGDIQFYNIYGQSESIACTFKVIDENDYRSSRPHLPVGKCHRDMDLLLVDDNGQPIHQSDTIGELYISGSTLFSGYWNNLELTNRCLIQNPLHNRFKDLVFKTGDLCYFDESGDFYFIGRKDNQIKINGNRVEIEELENTIADFPGVSNVCVFYQDQLLQAAISPASQDIDERKFKADIATYLCEKLPTYMLINVYHFVPSIPQSANGKNDRKKVAMQVLEAA